jgi:hypothetical protein
MDNTLADALKRSRMAGMEHTPGPRNAFASDRSAIVNSLALSTGFVPGIGDIAGLAADADMYATDPKSRNWKNYLMTGLGVLPFVPGAAHAIFAGPLAKTADVSALERAKAMAKMGTPDEAIWKETGWWINTPDGVPRFEIPDNNLRFKQGLEKSQNWEAQGQNEASLPFAEGVEHPEAFAAYDKFSDPDLHFGISSGDDSGFQADGLISIGVKDPESVTGFWGADAFEPKHRRILAHEMQHQVQSIEGMGLGSSVPSIMGLPADAVESVRREVSSSTLSPDILKKMDQNRKLFGSPELSDRDMAEIAAFRQYHRSAGEAESRAVEKRLRFSPEKRRETPPWLSYDVPLNSLIVRK